MKKLLLLALTGLSTGFLCADITELLNQAKEIGATVTTWAGPAKVYPNDTTISFEIRNKSKDELYFSVSSDGKVVSEDGTVLSDTTNIWLKVGSKKTAQIPVDISKKTLVTIYNPATGDNELHSLPIAKTLYLTWDGKVLRPQTGPAKGLLGKTETGLSIKNNVSKKDVKKELVIPAYDDDADDDTDQEATSS